VKNLAGATPHAPAQPTQERYVCPVCAGRFASNQLLTQRRPETAAPLRFQHRVQCCPHCKTVLRSRHEQRMTSLESGMWFVMAVVWLALRGPGRGLADLLLLGLAGAFLCHAVVTVVRHRRDPQAYVRDVWLDPPRTDLTPDA
jgi:hypothetical protein